VIVVIVMMIRTLVYNAGAKAGRDNQAEQKEL
jgi:hypothetical protein